MRKAILHRGAADLFVRQNWLKKQRSQPILQKQPTNRNSIEKLKIEDISSLSKQKRSVALWQIYIGRRFSEKYFSEKQLSCYNEYIKISTNFSASDRKDTKKRCDIFCGKRGYVDGAADAGHSRG